MEEPVKTENPNLSNNGPSLGGNPQQMPPATARLIEVGTHGHKLGAACDQILKAIQETPELDGALCIAFGIKG